MRKYLDDIGITDRPDTWCAGKNDPRKISGMNSVTRTGLISENCGIWITPFTSGFMSI